MYIYIYMCVYTYIYIYICICIHVNILFLLFFPIIICLDVHVREIHKQRKHAREGKSKRADRCDMHA